MLVVTRRRGESVIITVGGQFVAEVKIVGAGYNKVRLGIEAGQHVRITRKELADAESTN